jgi:uncharacterized protein (TIGR00251 family)
MTQPDFVFLRQDKSNDVWLDIHVIPNASQTHADGLHDGALRVRLHAPPVDGKANTALIAWLAGVLKIPKSQIELMRGQTAKRKQLRVNAKVAATANWQALHG